MPDAAQSGRRRNTLRRRATGKYTAPDLIAQHAKVSADINVALREEAGAVRGGGHQHRHAQLLVLRVVHARHQRQGDAGAASPRRREQAQDGRGGAEAEGRGRRGRGGGARKAQADGEAYANLKIATAQAEALRVQNAALAQNRDELELRRIEVERTKAERWNGVLPTAIYAGAPIPFLNVGK
jgi:hypothetical protein